MWKGPSVHTIVVKTGPCSYFFEVGQEYLVYADSVDEEMAAAVVDSPMEVDLAEGDFFIRGCSRTQLLADATEDLAALGEGTRVYAENAAPPSPLAAPLSPLLDADGTLLPPLCAMPLALIGILGFFPIRARSKASPRGPQ